MDFFNIGKVQNLRPEDEEKLRELIDAYHYHRAANEKKERYYEGHIPLNEVNLGIALPEGLQKLEIGCEWGCKTVDVLASRSMFDGFVGQNGEASQILQSIIMDNRMIAEYPKACRDELKFGCTFVTLSADRETKCKIRFHSPKTGSALWDGEKGRIGCGMSIIDTIPDESQKSTWLPSLIRMDTETDIIMISRLQKPYSDKWEARYYPHKMGRPMMEPMIYNATTSKPFGRSRIKEPVRRLIQGYIRTLANASIGLEFATAPQKYLMGITDEQYDAVTSNKFRNYVGSIIAGTYNPETGSNPVFGQLQQGNIQPHVEMMRVLATQFSAATGLTVTDTGVVNDANPTSSEAILAQSQTLVLMAEQLNAGNGDSLRNIALMALAIAKNCTLDELTDDEKDVVAHFKNPAMPSVSVTTDAAIKIASQRQEFAGTDVFLEMVGFNQADIRRIKTQEARIRGQQILTEEFNADITGDVD